MFYVRSLYGSYWYQITYYYQEFLMRRVSRHSAGLNTRTVKWQMRSSCKVNSQCARLGYIAIYTASLVDNMVLLGGGLPRTEVNS